MILVSVTLDLVIHELFLFVCSEKASWSYNIARDDVRIESHRIREGGCGCGGMDAMRLRDVNNQ